MQAKYEAAEILNNYLNYVDNNQKKRVYDARYLYHEFTLPAGNIYNSSLGFTHLFRPFSVIAYFSLGASFMIYLKVSMYFIMGLMIIAVILFIKCINRMKSKKVYGFNR